MTNVADAKTFKTSEATISYHDVGNGPALLCLHGGGPGATGWSNFAANAADLQAKYRLIIPDQPGFGGSQLTSDSGASYQRVSAVAMTELLAGLGITRAHILGNSMGGGVALTMAMRSPDLVDRLVLMGPFLPGFRVQVHSPEPLPLLREYYDDPTVERMRTLLRSMVADSKFDGFEDLVRQRHALSIEPRIREGYARMSRGKDPDPDPRPVHERVAALPNKTLLLWGREDRFSPLDGAFLLLSALKDSRLIVFPATGHWVQAERAPEFATYVSAFLSD